MTCKLIYAADASWKYLSGFLNSRGRGSDVSPVFKLKFKILINVHVTLTLKWNFFLVKIVRFVQSKWDILLQWEPEIYVDIVVSVPWFRNPLCGEESQ